MSIMPTNLTHRIRLQLKLKNYVGEIHYIFKSIKYIQNYT